MAEDIGSAALTLAKQNTTNMAAITQQIANGELGALTINPNHVFADNTARDAYFVTNPTELEDGIYISVGAGFQRYETDTWVDKTAMIKGAKGDTPVKGVDYFDGTNGKSAYQLAVDDGFADTEAQWLVSLEGTDGVTPIKGVDYDDGADGANAFVYIAYASDINGTGFTMTYNANLDYIAILATDTAIAVPAVGDFTGLWKNYKGIAGTNGTNAYTYIAYASADDGTGFTLTFNASLDYIAILSTDTEIVAPVASDFVGLWKKYKGVDGTNGTNGAGLDDLTTPAAVAHVDNTYTLDMAGKYCRVFDIESADANAKAIALSNVPNTAGRLLQIIIHIKCTTAAAFTHPTGVTFAAGTPTYTTGQEYWTSYDSLDGGTSYSGLNVRRE